jgi:signal transduction histidine kinase
VILELAHELKNPMVTIDTFVQQLDRLLEDPPLRDRFASLTREAVHRMDDYLETLLRFARFGAPAPRPILLHALLDEAFEREDRGAPRPSVLPPPSDVALHVDEEQAVFTLRALARAFRRKLQEGAELVVRWQRPDTLILESAASAGASQLHRLVSVDDRDEFSLDTLLARSLVDRTGGKLTITEDDQRAEMRLRWPLAGEEREWLAGGNGS